MAPIKFVLRNIPFIGLMIYCTGFLMWTGHEFYGMYQSQYWPKVASTVTRSEVRPTSGTYRWPHVVYAYTFNGTQYQNSKVVFGHTLGSQQTAQALTTLFPVGRAVEVVVNPTNPAISCLIPGPLLYWETYLMFIVHAAILLFVATILWQMYKAHI